MDSSHYGNAMTEIALALAMAFFSLMVLTLVSMGAGDGSASIPSQDTTAVKLTPPKADAPEATVQTVTEDDTLILFKDGAFFDRNLAAVDPKGLSPTGRVVLAIDPATPLADAMDARANFKTDNLIVSTLDPRWQAALAGSAPTNQ